MADWKVPLFSIEFGEEEEQAVLRPVRAAWLTMGQEVAALEDTLKEMSGAKHAIAVTNCTAALQLACVAAGVGAGDEVICPALTFVASANAPRVLGADIRFADSIGPDDLTVDPQHVESLITPKTKAIMAVHYAGFPCMIEALQEIACRHGLALIEDCAHALFTEHHGKMLGRFGVAGCLSFFSNKNATCGEGGALLTDLDEVAEQARLLRSHGMTTLTLDRHKGRASSYDVALAGYNARIDEVRAALIGVQLGRLEGYLDRRRHLFKRYAEKLTGSPVTVPFTTGRFAGTVDQVGVHIMPVLLPEGVDKMQVMAAMKADGIQTSFHYPPIHSFTAYQGQGASLPRTEALCERELTLPLYPAMTDEQVDLVVESLLNAVQAPAPAASEPA